MDRAELRKQVLSRTGHEVKKVEIPEWSNDPLYVRGMTGAEWESFLGVREELEAEKASMKIQVKMIITCICDKDGKNLFEDEDAEDLLNMNAVLIGRVAAMCLEACQLSDKDIDELEKN